MGDRRVFMRLLMLLRAIFNAYANYTKNPLSSIQLTTHSSAARMYIVYIEYTQPAIYSLLYIYVQTEHIDKYDPMRELNVCVCSSNFMWPKKFNNTIKTPLAKPHNFPNYCTHTHHRNQFV